MGTANVAVVPYCVLPKAKADGPFKSHHLFLDPMTEGEFTEWSDFLDEPVAVEPNLKEMKKALDAILVCTAMISM